MSPSSLRPTLALAALLAAGASLAAPRQQAVNVSLEPPDGWRRRVDDTGALRFMPAGDACMLRVLPGEDAAALGRWFDGAWGALHGELAGVEHGPALFAPAPSVRGARVRAAEATGRDARGGALHLYFVAVQSGRRVQPFLLTAQQPEAYARCRAQVRRAVTSVRFVETILRPAPTRQPLARTGWRLYPLTAQDAALAAMGKPTPGVVPASGRVPAAGASR